MQSLNAVNAAAQVAFVDPPKLDFDLQMPSDSHGSGLLNYVEGWADAFITDNILSKYVLPDHYFAQIDKVSFNRLDGHWLAHITLHFKRMSKFASNTHLLRLLATDNCLNKVVCINLACICACKQH